MFGKKRNVENVEEKVQEVTIEDIEKKFGCKVKFLRDKDV